MLRLVKAKQMDPKIHIMEATVFFFFFFLQYYFNFLKLIVTSKPAIRNRAPIDEPNRLRKANFTYRRTESIEESQLHQN